MVPVHHGWLWFPDHPGLVSGLVIGGFGLGVLVFSNFSTWVINPDNLAIGSPGYETEIHDRFVKMLIWLWFCYVVLALIGITFIFSGPLKKEADALSHQLNPTADNSLNFPVRPTFGGCDSPRAIEKSELLEEATMKEMLLSKNFILIYVMNSLSFFTGFFVVNQTKNYGSANGMTDDQFLALIGSLGAIFNSIRFIWSWLLDYYSYKKVYGALLTSQIILNFTIFFVNHNQWLYGVWICAFMFCAGGHFVLAPNIMKQIYGKKATALYGILFSYTAVSSIIQIIF